MPPHADISSGSMMPSSSSSSSDFDGSSTITTTTSASNTVNSSSKLADEEGGRTATAAAALATMTTGTRRQIGLTSAVFITINRIIGTGVFATPSTILRLSGSMGVALCMWVLGAIIAGAGMYVYILWGTMIPKSGGEKNYLEYIFRRPKYLITCVFASNAVLLGWASANSIVFSQYILLALDFNRIPDDDGSTTPSTPTPASHPWAIRMVASLCLTSVFLLHSTAVKWGLRVQNALGVLKLFILMIVVFTGVLAFYGYSHNDNTTPGPGGGDGVPLLSFAITPSSFQNPVVLNNNNGGGRQGSFEKPISTTTQMGLSGFCLGMSNVIWSYIGYSNVNYSLSEVRDPHRTIRIAGPLALVIVGVLYVLANVAYFVGVPDEEEIVGSGTLVAAVLFRNVYGEGGVVGRVLAGFVALSAVGNVMSVMFAFGRVNQELGREGILPYSEVFASSRPFDAPMAGLALHWVVCMTVVLVLPSGDAYNFILNLITYPLSAINATISFGFLYILHTHQHHGHYLRRKDGDVDFDWPYHTLPILSQLVVLFFGLVNVFLVVVPMMEPPKGAEAYERLPYWAHAFGGWVVLVFGVVYWGLWVRGKDGKIRLES